MRPCDGDEVVAVDFSCCGTRAQRFFCCCWLGEADPVGRRKIENCACTLITGTHAGFGAAGEDGGATRAQAAAREAGEGQEKGEPCLQSAYWKSCVRCEALARPRRLKKVAC